MRAYNRFLEKAFRFLWGKPAHKLLWKLADVNTPSQRRAFEELYGKTKFGDLKGRTKSFPLRSGRHTKPLSDDIHDVVTAAAKDRRDLAQLLRKVRNLRKQGKIGEAQKLIHEQKNPKRLEL